MAIGLLHRRVMCVVYIHREHVHFLGGFHENQEIMFRAGSTINHKSMPSIDFSESNM